MILLLWFIMIYLWWYGYYDYYDLFMIYDDMIIMI